MDHSETLLPLREFLTDDGKTIDESRIPDRLREKGYSIETLIATLPDPVDSRFRYQFDVQLDAIEQAVQANGYVVDRFALPWLTSDGRPLRNGGVAPGAPPPAPMTIAQAGLFSSLQGLKGPMPSNAPAFRERPGLVLFRKTGSEQNRLILMLLVGETPTWGVQRGAFANALEIASRFSARAEARTPGIVRALGPSFSGSGPSMAAVLSGSVDKLKDCEVWVCSGSATSLSKNDFQEWSKPAKVRYTATVVPDKIALKKLYEHLQFDKETAYVLLVESGTGYGAEISGQDAGESPDKQIVIQFPLHLAQLRSARDRNEQQKNSSGANPLAAAMNAGIAIPLDEGEPPDIVPSFAPAMTAPSDELILKNILSTIARKRVRFVGIVATDVRDIIFLTESIRAAYPDVLIFLSGGDLRLTHPGINHNFRGTIVVSSYPLNAEAQDWTFPYRGSERKALFTHDVDMGSYNAGVVLLNAAAAENDPDGLVIPKDEHTLNQLLNYGHPFDNLRSGTPSPPRPAVWINVIGQHDLWPIRAFRVPLEDGFERLVPSIDDPRPAGATPVVEAIHSERPAPAPNGGWGTGAQFDSIFSPSLWIVLGAVCLIGILTSAGFLYASKRLDCSSCRSLGLFDALGAFANDEKHQGRVAIVHACGGLSLLSIAVALASSASNFEAPILLNGSDWALFGIVYGTLVIIILTLVALAFRRGSLQPKWPFITKLFHRWDSVTLLTALACSGIFVWLLIDQFGVRSPEPDVDRLLSSHKGLAIQSGVSPMIPVLFLAGCFYAFGLMLIYRYRLLDLQHCESPFKHVQPTDPSRVLRDLKCQSETLEEILSRPLKIGSFVVLLLLAIFLTGPLLMELNARFVKTPEGPAFDLCIRIAFAAFVLILCAAFVRMIILWAGLKDFFDRLSHLPMASAYERLTPSLRAEFGRFLQAQTPTPDDVAFPSQKARRLWALIKSERCPSKRDAKETLARSIEQELAKAEQDSAPNQPPRFTYAMLCGITKSMIPALEAWWPNRSLESAFGGDAEGAGKDSQEQAPGSTSDLKPGDGWLIEAEDLLAILIVQYVSYFATHIRMLISFLTLGPLLLLFAVTWYPFQPQNLLSIVIWTFLISVATAVVIILVQIERDPFVSRVSHTRPNAVMLDRTFLMNIATYMIPFLALLLAKFPDVAYWLNNLFEPIGQVLH